MYKNNRIKKQNCCLICFKEFNSSYSLHNIFSINPTICDSCLNKFKVIRLASKVNGIKTLFLYEYNSFIKSLIYQYKGCYDIALKDVFFYQFKKEIIHKYKHYIIVFPPSNKEDDLKRGFKHIEMIISCLNIKYLDIFYKEKPFKQSSHNYEERKNIKNIIKMKNVSLDLNKKYLIVDDIYTSGATLKKMILLLENKGIKKENIEALIIAKTA